MDTYRHSDFEYIDARIGWNNAWLVLAVRRYREFLAEAGVPDSIVGNPGPAIEDARNAVRQLPVAPEHLQGIVSGFLSSIEASYGHHGASELASWAIRFFIDSAAEIAWYGWSSMLPMLSGAHFPDRLPRVSSPLDPQATARFNQIVRERFVHTQYFETQGRLESAASRIEFSDEELNWLRLESTGSEEEPEFIFLSDIVSLLIVQEQAFQAWQKIKAEFTIEQQQLICDWAVRESREDGRGDLTQYELAMETPRVSGS